MGMKRTAVEAWEALFRAQVSIMRDISAAFPSDVMSVAEYDVLFNLTRLPGRHARQRDLTKRLLLSQPSVSRMIDRLAARGWVEKSEAPDDARGTIVTITDDGFRRFREVAVAHAAAIAERFDGILSPEELELLASLCDRLRTGGPNAAAD